MRIEAVLTRAAALGAALTILTIPAVAETVRVTPGQPLCADQDSLAALVAAAVSGAPEPDVPCESIRPASTATVIERYPSGAPGMHIVKVRVTAPGSGSEVGYTIELAPN